VRVSGPKAGGILQGLTKDVLPGPRRATIRRFFTKFGEVIDQGLVLWFPAPASFTGEDVAEIHVHGGRAVVQTILDALANYREARMAEPGEFTRRAFANGKLDLTEAEGLADLVAAETEAQRRQALRQMNGDLGRLYEGWRAGLIGALAHLEADIDFPDEDLPQETAQKVRPRILALRDEIARHLDDNRRGERLRAGLGIAILGPPNVGKSSLINYLAQREAAIVSAKAGTTRDVIEVELDLGGYPVLIADTAGLREVADEVESEGIRRARARALQADLKILMFDAETWPGKIGEFGSLIDGDTFIAINKIDLQPIKPPPNDIAIDTKGIVPISVLNGFGMQNLLDRLVAAIVSKWSLGETATITRSRHRQALTECVSALNRYMSATLSAEFLPELAVEDIRLAARALGRITGRVDVEDILDVVFADFCIGK
jgi:tRNA modification GTPase